MNIDRQIRQWARLIRESTEDGMGMLNEDVDLKGEFAKFIDGYAKRNGYVFAIDGAKEHMKSFHMKDTMDRFEDVYDAFWKDVKELISKDIEDDLEYDEYIHVRSSEDGEQRAQTAWDMADEQFDKADEELNGLYEEFKRSGRQDFDAFITNEKPSDIIPLYWLEDHDIGICMIRKLDESADDAQVGLKFGAVLGFRKDVEFRGDEEGEFRAAFVCGKDREEFFVNLKDMIGPSSQDIGDSWKVCDVEFVETDQNGMRKIEQGIEKLNGEGQKMDQGMFSERLDKIVGLYQSVRTSELGWEIKGNGSSMSMSKDEFLKNVERKIGEIKSCRVYRTEKGDWLFQDLKSGQKYGPRASFYSWRQADAYRAAEKAGYTDIRVVED